MTTKIISLCADDLAGSLTSLANLLVNGVNSGASISFVLPFTIEEAIGYWQHSVFPSVCAGERQLYLASVNGTVVGTVQLITTLSPNQAHRCEVSKLIVDTNFRGNGMGRLLMERVVQEAERLNKSLITLDTAGDVAQSLYASLGFEIAGAIPDFALDPDGKKFSSTTYMYKRI